MLLVSISLSFFYHSIMLIVWFIFSSGQNHSNTWYERFGGAYFELAKSKYFYWEMKDLLKVWSSTSWSIFRGEMENKENRFLVDFGLSCRRHKRTFVLRFSDNILSMPDRRAVVLRASICIFHEQYERKSSFGGWILFFRPFRCSNNIGPCWTLNRVNKEWGESQLHVSHLHLRRREDCCLCSAVRPPPPRSTLSSQMSTTTTPSLTSPYLLTSPSEKKRPTF